MGQAMSEPEWRDFISRGHRTGKLGAVRSDGRPLVVPIWFVLDDDGVIRLQTSVDSAKTRAVIHEPRVCLTLDDEEPPHAFVMIEAVATVVHDDELMWRVAYDCARRYMGADRADEVAGRNAVPGECVIELRPIRVVAESNVSP
jgi:PPOX class probable F420-dependent enzyme